MKSVILFAIAVALIIVGYKILPLSSNGLDANTQPTFVIYGLNQKSIAIILFVVAGLLIIWGLFSIQWVKK